MKLCNIAETATAVGITERELLNAIWEKRVPPPVKYFGYEPEEVEELKECLKNGYPLHTGDS